MVDLDRCRGVGQFGPAYPYMFTRDAAAEADTVDQRIVECMVRVCAETGAPVRDEPYRPGSRPVAAVWCTDLAPLACRLVQVGAKRHVGGHRRRL